MSQAALNGLRIVRLEVLIRANWHLRHRREVRYAILGAIQEIRELRNG